MRFAILFPGQGSRYVDTDPALFEARRELLVDTADEVLGWSLRELCTGGDERIAARTERAQPALYALSYALWDVMRESLPAAPMAAAGHSLGEYTALAASGAVSFVDGLRLVAARGEAMAAAAAEAASGMAALLGADEATAEAIAADRRAAGGALWVANVNDPKQVVVAGGAADIEWVVGSARELGVARAVPLEVSGAFHSPYMSSAAARLGAALADVAFRVPAFAVYGNTDAAPLTDPGAALARQLTAPVRFRESLEAMAAAGVEVFVHVGPGNVTAGMAKRSVPGAGVVTVSGLDDVAEAVAGLTDSVE